MAKGQGRKVDRPPIDRNWKGWRGSSRSLQHRLEIRGQKPRLSQDSKGGEVLFEEQTGLATIRQQTGKRIFRRLWKLSVRQIHRSQIAGERSAMVVLQPA